MTTSQPTVSASSYKRIRVELDMSEADAADLASAIYESRSAVDNWRSDPQHLVRLEEALRETLGLPMTYPGAKP